MDINKRKETILIVDDMPINIEVVARGLKSDYRIKVATNGEDALKMAQSDHPPDMILLDVVMPEMDGYEVCRRLKSDDRSKDIPVIFLTIKGEVEDETMGLELGAVDYITKPFSLPIVKARVHTHLTIQRLIAELRGALADVKKLSGLLPICASCKAIRDDEGYWHRVESYIGNHSEADFSHGICPDCAKKFYDELDLVERN